MAPATDQHPLDIQFGRLFTAYDDRRLTLSVIVIILQLFKTVICDYIYILRAVGRIDMILQMRLLLICKEQVVSLNVIFDLFDIRSILDTRRYLIVLRQIFRKPGIYRKRFPVLAFHLSGTDRLSTGKVPSTTSAQEATA